jgi:DNA-binding YbaB/EbfC family protein
MTDPTGSGPGGMDLGGLLKTARDMQEKLQNAQATAGKIEVEGQAGGGMVRATANGNGQVIRIKLEQSLMDMGDLEMIEDLTTAAVNDALARAKEAQAAELSKVTQGLPLPVDLSKLF